MKLKFPRTSCNAASDPECKEANGSTVCEFRVAIPERRQSNGGQWEEIGTTFATVQVWGAKALNVMASVRKGDPLIVEGAYVDQSWINTEGVRVEKHVIRADLVVPNLSLCTFAITRTKGKAAASEGQGQSMDSFARQDDVPLDEWGMYAQDTAFVQG